MDTHTPVAARALLYCVNGRLALDNPAVLQQQLQICRTVLAVIGYTPPGPVAAVMATPQQVLQQQALSVDDLYRPTAQLLHLARPVLVAVLPEMAVHDWPQLLASNDTGTVADVHGLRAGIDPWQQYVVMSVLQRLSSLPLRMQEALVRRAELAWWCQQPQPQPLLLPPASSVALLQSSAATLPAATADHQQQLQQRLPRQPYIPVRLAAQPVPTATVRLPDSRLELRYSLPMSLGQAQQQAAAVPAPPSQ